MKRIIVLLTVLVMLAAGAAFAEETEYSISVPNGAPALAVAALGNRVHPVAASLIAGEFGNNEADFIIAPVNAGAKLYKAGKSTYKLAALVTWGNLVFASQIPDFSLETMNGKKVTLFGENTINASIALFILKEKNIEPSEIIYLADAAETQALLIKDPEEIVMTAEPAITGALMSLAKENKTAVSVPLYDLYQEITGDNGFAQAGLFVREETIRQSPETVKKGLQEIREAAEKCSADPDGTAKTAVEMGIIAKEAIALKAIPGCHIFYLDAVEAKTQIERIVSIDPVQFGGEAPADDFYYDAK
ncbi:MAG: hypothetical protein IKG87_03500 [Clostridia bacterium]|nr:hypothetical protein [Clostridia bacterium]